MKIVLLTCLNATKICSAVACFRALDARESYFECYRGNEVKLVALMHCNGCSCNIHSNSDFIEKFNTICKLEPDVVHIGKCAIQSGMKCEMMVAIGHDFIKNGIPVVWGTH